MQHAHAATTVDLSASERRRIARRAMRCLDLTTLSGNEGPQEIEAICSDARTHHVAAVCVYGRSIAAVRRALEGTTIQAASVAMGFPDARGTLKTRCQEITDALDAGAQEIDIIVTTQHILDGAWDRLAEEIRAARRTTGTASLKVILETGALPSVDAVYRSARVALDEGADFIKTSTGKIAVGATPDAAAAMLLALEDHGDERGIKLSGGLRQFEDLLPYHRMLSAQWGVDAFTPHRVRIGASSLLTALQEASKGAEIE